jgi:hypothetical protein
VMTSSAEAIVPIAVFKVCGTLLIPNCIPQRLRPR